MEHPLPTGGVKFFFLSFLPFVKHKKFKWLRDEKEKGEICSTLVAINMNVFNSWMYRLRVVHLWPNVNSASHQDGNNHVQDNGSIDEILLLTSSPSRALFIIYFYAIFGRVQSEGGRVDGRTDGRPYGATCNDRAQPTRGRHFGETRPAAAGVQPLSFRSYLVFTGTRRRDFTFFFFSSSWVIAPPLFFQIK